MQSKIKFGTDGWRGIIAEDFNFKNINMVSNAISEYLKCHKATQIAIGYDTRFMSNIYAQYVGGIISTKGIRVILSQYPVPTPVLSYYVMENKLSGGVMITASHNPYIYNGIKFKEPCGASSSPETTKEIEKYLSLKESLPIQTVEKVEVDQVDLMPNYLYAINRYLELPKKTSRKLKVVVDSMYGAGGRWIEAILTKYGHEVITINADPNPNFPGINPEPIDKHLKNLKKEVVRLKADIGIATDGDADRVGIVTDKGKFIIPHYVLSLLLIHFKEDRMWDGPVGKTISTTSLINKLCNHYGVECYETPVGFKHIAYLMLKKNLLIGGEESGGNGFRNHIPERDGILSGLLLVEMMLHRGKSLSKLVQDMEKEFGKFAYNRIDMHLEREKIEQLYKMFKKNPPDRILDKKVREIKDYDGFKFILSDGSWLLFRASGTEPLLRLYSEAEDIVKVRKLLKFAEDTVGRTT